MTPIEEICQCTARNLGLQLPDGFCERVEAKIKRRAPPHNFKAFTQDGATADAISERIMIDVIEREFSQLREFLCMGARQ